MERQGKIRQRIKRLEHQSSRKERKPLKTLGKTNTNLLKHPLAKVVVFGVIVYGALHISKYFIRATTGMIDACKQFKNACNR